MALENEYMLEELTAEEIYQKKLTAGANITINPITNEISSTGGGSSVQYTSNYAQGDILGTLNIDGASSAIRTPNLVEGENISITRDQQTGAVTISSTGGSGDLSAHELTEEAYNNLTPAEKTNGELYLTHPATPESSEPNKIYYNDTLYGTEGGNDVVELTQAEWDALPSSKLTDGIIYVITDSGGGGGASAISDLTDVELTDLANGEILKYDAIAEKWVNAVESKGNNGIHIPPVIFDDGNLKKVNDVDGFPGLEKVFLAPSDYEALTQTEKEDLSKIYYVSEYDYYSDKGGTLVLRVKNDEIKLFVNGFVDENTELKDGNLVGMINDKIRELVGSYFIGSIAYDENKEPIGGSLPYVYIDANYSRIAFRNASGGSSNVIHTTTYAVIDLTNYSSSQGSVLQSNPWVDPYDVSGGMTIYYGDKQYSEYEIPNPLPEVTSADAGKALVVNSEGEWNKGDIREVPAVTLSDEEKILTVESGTATWASPKKITHLYDVIPLENPLYRIGSITPSTSPVTIDMMQITPNYSELLSTDFEFVFMQDESDLCMRAWYGNPIDNTPGTFSYTPSTGELIATLRGGFTGGQFGIAYKKSVIQISQPALVSGSTATIDCSDIPNAETLTVADFALVITNVYEPSTSNNGNISLGYNFSYDQTTKTFSGYVGAGAYNQLTVSGYFIVANYGNPEYRLITDFQGASASSDGYHGFVPAPLTTDRAKFLRGDGTWAPNDKAYIFNALKYSETEQQVGVWVDGKPIYQKTWALSTPLHVASDWTNTAIDSTDIDRIIECLTFHSDGTCYDEISADPTRNSHSLVGLRAPSNGLNVSYITLQYTKISDTAGSGGYQAYGFSPIIYSEEEREVGVWIDNKPLYQKTFYKLNQQSSFSDYVDFAELTGVETVVSMLCNVKRSDIWMTAISASRPELNNTNYFFGVRYYNNHVQYRIDTYGTQITDMYVTIQYTKTTDVAGSGSYNTLGIPMTHIDSNEQVIGTLFGETLYQKSYQTTVTVTSTARAWYTLITSSQLRVINADKILIDDTHSFIELNDSIVNLNYSSIVNAAGGTAGCSYTSIEDEVQVCLYGFAAGTYPATVTIQYTKSTS